MDNKEISQYIDKLKEFEKLFSSEEIDEKFISDVNKLSVEISKKISTDNVEVVIPVGIKKLHENSVIPKYSTNGDAGLDLVVTKIIEESDNHISYDFGLSIEIPYGYVGLLFPRSSIRNKGLILSNSVGVIDSGYRGSLMATFKKVGDGDVYSIGDRAAQLIILPYPQIKFVEKEELTNTERGVGGYGSTGK